MFGTSTKLKALGGAESALEAYSAGRKALQAEVRKLGDLILQRVEAERALVEVETAVALGGEEGSLAGARRRLDNAMAAIDKKSRVLGGLRSRIAQQAPDLAGKMREIQAGLPEHIRGLKADFEGEWAKGVAAFGVLLGKRRALEAVLGKLELDEPQAASCDLGDTAAPWRVMKELLSSLELIAAWSRASISAEVAAMGGNQSVRSYDPRAVYVLARAYSDELPSGALVMEASLAPGELGTLVGIEYAVSFASQEWRKGLEAGSRAFATLTYEEQQAALAASAPPCVPFSPVEMLRAQDAAQENTNSGVRLAAQFGPSDGGRVTI
jgi:hypothetical protein